jgi:hypothetical protein
MICVCVSTSCSLLFALCVVLAGILLSSLLFSSFASVAVAVA